MGSGKDGALKVLYLAKTSVGAPWAVRQTRDHVRLGVEAHLAAPVGGPRIAEYEAAGVTVHPMETDFPIMKPWLAPGRFRQLRALVAELQPDIIHSYYVGTTLTARLALGKGHPIPRAFQVPGPLHLEHAFFRRAEIATAGPRDYWIGTCHSIRDTYRRAGITDDRLFVSDYGVDLEEHVYHPKGRIRGEFGIPEDVPLVGMVGIMYAPKRYLLQRRGLKGHEDLIDALAIVLKEQPGVMGIFVGGGWDGAHAYEERVRAYGKARCGDRLAFLGMRSDVPELLPDFDIAVQPSHTEGVAGTAVEAQLLGIPVIATNVGGQPDLIVDGETGWLVPPKDPPAMAAAILDALHDPERTRAMAARGHDRAEALFNGKANNAAVLEMYARMLAHLGRTTGVPSLRSTPA
ncbi:MAG: glycosyltransferase [Thermomicrobiales bacterium]